MTNDPSHIDLTPADVIKMPLDEFEKRFGFRPVDALDKHYYAITAIRLDPVVRQMIESGILGVPNLSNVVMD